MDFINKLAFILNNNNDKQICLTI